MLFNRANKPDSRVYSHGADSRYQNSRAYVRPRPASPLHLLLLTRGLLRPFLQMLALIAYLGIFLFGCELRYPCFFPLRSSLT
jgi:hypothetical protein